MKHSLRTIAFLVLVLSPRLVAAQTSGPQATIVTCSVSVHDVYLNPIAGIAVTVQISGKSPVTGRTDANGSVRVSDGRATTTYQDVSCSINPNTVDYFALKGDTFFQDGGVDPGSIINYSSSIVVTPKPTASTHVLDGDADLFQSGSYDKPVVIAQPFFTDEPVKGRMSAGQLWREYNGNPALLTKTGGLLMKMKELGYDVWLVRPRSIGDNIFDQATIYARAVQLAHTRASFNRPVAVAGFSLAGLVVRTAMSRWGFDAGWRAANGLADAPPVSLIVTLDSPLRGAIVSRGAQGTFWNVSFDGDGQSAHDHNMDTCAAQQMLELACHKALNAPTALECNDRGWHETYYNGGTFDFCNPNQGVCSYDPYIIEQFGGGKSGMKRCVNPTGMGIENQPNGGWPSGIKKIAASLGHPGESSGVCYGDASGRDRTGELHDGCPQADAKTFGEGELWGFIEIIGHNRYFYYETYNASDDHLRYHFVDELTPGSRQPGSVEDVDKTKFLFFKIVNGHQLLHMGTFIPLYSALDEDPVSHTIPFDEYWTSSYNAFHDALSDDDGDVHLRGSDTTRRSSLVNWLLGNLAIALPDVPPSTGCGEATCVPAQGAYISHFTGPGCTGTESYYLPYDGFAYSCRTWDGNGQCGTVQRVVTNTSYKYQGQCFDAWPGGNQLSNFVTVYRGPISPVVTYALGVTVLGTGAGTVASNPSGIACGAACTASFPASTVVTLTAAPANGSTFTGWSGGGCSGTGSCSVTMTAATSVVATFNAASTGCGEATCVPAQAAYISHFTGADCTGTESYYLPYNGYTYACRTWDGGGQCGTIRRTVTNVAYKYQGQCYNEWPGGNQLSDFVTVYRGGAVDPDVLPQSVDVAPVSATGVVGDLLQYVATAHYADGSTHTTQEHGGLAPIWRSTNASVTTVDADGVVHLVAAGMTQIVAQFGTVSCEATTTCGTLSVNELNTPTGEEIIVEPVDIGTPLKKPLIMMFDDITAPGVTTVTTSTNGPPIPDDYAFGGTYFDITTTALFNGSVATCASYDDAPTTDGSDVRLLHYQDGAWADVTVAVSTQSHYVCGATDTLSPFAVVVILDHTPPAIGDVIDVTVEAASAAGSVVSFTLPSVSDDHDANPSIAAVPASGTLFSIGPTTVTVTATDNRGNESTKTFTVTVADRTPPLVAVADVTIEATGPTTPVTFAASASDLVDGVMTPSCVPASGSQFAVGRTEIICDATDAHGNTGSARSVVTVTDTTPPSIQTVTPSTMMLWPPNGEMTTVGIEVQASDLVTAAPACRIESVASNEAGSGQWQVTGALTLNLAAARSGNGAGRIYTVIVSCSDAAGNVSSPAVTTVLVPHDRGDR